jgi:Domain of unknown function (DUF1844)
MDENTAPSGDGTASRAAAADTDLSTGPSARDLAGIPAVEVIATLAVHLMTAAAVHLGLGEEAGAGVDEQAEGGFGVGVDLDEARKLITALAGLVTAAAGEIGSQHARPLRDGLRTLQLAFREASLVADPPGEGPGEKLTGPVYPARS